MGRFLAWHLLSLGGFVLGGLALAFWACSREGGSGGPTGARASDVCRGPQVALLTQESATIAFRTAGTGSAALELGTTGEYGIRVESPEASTEHVFSLSGLSAGTGYHYRVWADGRPSGSDHVFTTPASGPEAPLVFAVLADGGAGTLEQRRIAERIASSGAALVLIAGDVVYEEGAESEIDPHYFAPYADLIDRIPFYPTLGNHDVRTSFGEPLLAALYLPTNDEEGTERYYSFDVQGAHFVGLDSNLELGPGSAQNRWLERDLQGSRARWKFVYFHHPPYSSSYHGSDLVVREALVPVFDRHGVDVVFCGHDHNYERTFPLRGDAVDQAESDPNYVSPEGTVYVVTGGGGSTLYGSGWSYFTAAAESTFHFVRVELSDTQLTLEAVLQDGGVIDRMTIREAP